MNGVCDRYCNGCAYQSREYGSCDYILITGHSRGCPPGQGCTRKEIGKRKDKNHEIMNRIVTEKIARKKYKRRKDKGIRKLDREEELRRLRAWEAGLSDYEIAQKLGISRSTVKQWRNTRGYKANGRSYDA